MVIEVFVMLVWGLVVVAVVSWLLWEELSEMWKKVEKEIEDRDELKETRT